MLKLISWNTNHRRAQAEDQVTAILQRNPDIVALQEVTPKTASILKAVLEARGFGHVEISQMSPDAELRHKLGVLTGSRTPVRKDTNINFCLPSVWEQKALSLVAITLEMEFELHNVHIPPGSTNDRAKVDVLGAIFKGLSRIARRPRLLCGDFNAPRLELPSGEIVTWAQREVAPYSLGWKGRDKTWDEAERNIIAGPCGMRDAFRLLHGSSRKEFSWRCYRNGKVVAQRRFDHVFASPDVQILRCEYIHTWREEGLSDHSAIEVEFAKEADSSPRPNDSVIETRRK